MARGGEAQSHRYKRARGRALLLPGKAEWVEEAREERRFQRSGLGKSSYRNSREEPVERLGSIPRETSRCCGDGEWDSPTSWKVTRLSFTARVVWSVSTRFMSFITVLMKNIR
jgi:hypothetical protein